jgi:hypothetical protein
MNRGTAMTIQKIAYFVTITVLFSWSSVSQAKEYTCEDLPSLHSQVKEDGGPTSVAALIIRFMGRLPNPCVTNLKETTNSVEVMYLDHESIAFDIFNFSNENKLVSRQSTFLDSTTEITNF